MRPNQQLVRNASFIYSVLWLDTRGTSFASSPALAMMTKMPSSPLETPYMSSRSCQKGFHLYLLGHALPFYGRGGPEGAASAHSSTRWQGLHLNMATDGTTPVPVVVSSRKFKLHDCARSSWGQECSKI
ncbi:hypothetical protein VNO77_17751 [Canavalia gladiata]|uniref:Uncharacterized protein n=1 Tax=Canavalia gladiata TaxID=3824 RepID=A0AAN9QIZ6_CANGL